MFRMIKQRLRDMQTIRSLCVAAEKLANGDGHRQPAAEHFLMAALAMQDGTARRAFLQAGADPDLFHAAVAAQHRQALEEIGIHIPDIAPAAPSSRPALYDAAASGQALMKKLAEMKTGSAQPLLSAHVLMAALAARLGTTPRALQGMGLDRERLAAAAAAEIARFPPGREDPRT